MARLALVGERDENPWRRVALVMALDGARELRAAPRPGEEPRPGAADDAGARAQPAAPVRPVGPLRSSGAEEASAERDEPGARGDGARPDALRDEGARHGRRPHAGTAGGSVACGEAVRARATGRRPAGPHAGATVMAARQGRRPGSGLGPAGDAGAPEPARCCRPPREISRHRGLDQAFFAPC